MIFVAKYFYFYKYLKKIVFFDNEVTLLYFFS